MSRFLHSKDLSPVGYWQFHAYSFLWVISHLIILAGMAFMLLVAYAFIGSITAKAQTRAEYRVEKVLDGDTIRACPTKGALILCQTIRINNLNTPEKNLCSDKLMEKASACERCSAGATLGKKATAFATNLFRSNKIVYVEKVNRDKYNRMVGRVFLPDGREYAKIMVDAGLGVAYPCKNGKCPARPRPWCPVYP